MNVIITSLDNNLNAKFDLRFGRSAWLCLYNTESQKTEFLVNENKDIDGGAGTKTAEKVAELAADQVISGDFGPKAKTMLEKLKIQMIIPEESNLTIGNIIEKLQKNIFMKRKFAVPVDSNGVLDAHFGHCKYFALHTVEQDGVSSSEMVVPPPHEPGVLPGWLANLGVTDVLAGGMGNRAIQLFNQQGVNVFVGAPQFKAEKLVEGYLNNSIEFSANYCDH